MYLGRWIIAKYRWYGFVGEDSRDLDAVSKSMLYVSPPEGLHVGEGGGGWRWCTLVYFTR